MTRGGVAKRVREHKDQHPEFYCPVRACLWRTGGGPCPNHKDLWAAAERKFLGTFGED